MKTMILTLAALAMLDFALAHRRHRSTDTTTTTTASFIFSTTNSTITDASTDGINVTTAVATIVSIVSTPSISSSYANPTCDAGIIVDSCLSITTGKQLGCDTDDFTCQCNAYQAIETCFDNCPNDPRQRSFFPMIEQYCDLAGLPTTRVTGTATTSLTTTRRGNATPTGHNDEEKPTGTKDNTVPTGGSRSGGARLVNGAGGAMAAAGLVAAFL